MTENMVKQAMSKRFRYTPTEHTCWEYMQTYDGDGPSPSEVCELCRTQLCLHALRSPPISLMEEPCRLDEVVVVVPRESAWDEDTRRTAEDMILKAKDAALLMEFDQHFGIERPWWFYEEMMDKEEEDAKKFMEEFKACKAKQAEFGYWYRDEDTEAKRKQAEEDLKAYRAKLAGIPEVEMPDNARHYIRSVDGRSGKVREAEFEEWLAIPKNKRPIYLEGGKKGPAVAKADIGSVVIKNCPPSVLLCDIRIVLAKFGGVRDVYRPRDRATGKPKPFVFVEMLKNAEAWAAVDYFAKHPFVLDDHTFATEGAGERKTSAEMATIAPVAVQEAAEELPVAKQHKPVKATGAFAEQAELARLASPYKGSFAALMDSDSDSE